MESFAGAALPNPCISFIALVSLSLSQHITKFLQRAPTQFRFFPQIGRQEAVCVAHRHECSLQCVFECFRRAGGGGVDILNTSQLE